MSTDRSRSQVAGDEAQGDQADKSNKPVAKPRASRAGTRSVSTLNAEQLARKRANDREAQRAIRQRTKEHIERLENRIKELSGEDGFNIENHPAYEEARRRNLELEEEVRRLKAILGASEDRASSPETSYSDAGYAVTPPTGGEANYNHSWNSPNISAGLPGFTATPTTVPQTSTQWPPGNQFSGYATTTAGTSRTASPYGSDFGSESGSVAGHPAHIPYIAGVHNPAVQRAHYAAGRGDYAWQSPSNPTIAALGNGQSNSSPGPQNLSQAYATFVKQPSVNIWEIPLQFCSPTDDTDQRIINIVNHLRSLRAEGVTGVTLVGPPEPNVGLVVQPGYSKPVHALIHTGADVTSSEPFRGLTERLGTFIILYPLFQWLIGNTYETYTQLPESLVPTPTQLNVPHALWVSLLFWPQLRDQVIANQERYSNEGFKDTYSSSLILNWPYQPQDAVEMVGDEWRATKLFARHARLIDNWSLGPLFQRRYPELRDYCRFAT